MPFRIALSGLNAAHEEHPHLAHPHANDPIGTRQHPEFLPAIIEAVVGDLDRLAIEAFEHEHYAEAS